MGKHHSLLETGGATERKIEMKETLNTKAPPRKWHKHHVLFDINFGQWSRQIDRIRRIDGIGPMKNRLELRIWQGNGGLTMSGGNEHNVLKGDKERPKVK